MKTFGMRWEYAACLIALLPSSASHGGEPQQKSLLEIHERLEGTASAFETIEKKTADIADGTSFLQAMERRNGSIARVSNMTSELSWILSGGRSWQAQLPGGLFSSLSSSVAITPDGEPWVAYTAYFVDGGRTGPRLKNLFKRGYEQVNPPAYSLGYFIDSATTPAGGHQVALMGSSIKLYSKETSNSSWSSELVSEDLAQGPISLTRDSNGDPWILYRNNDNSQLRSARKGGGAWTLETVDPLPDSGNTKHLALIGESVCAAYHRAQSHDLYFAWHDGATWSREAVATSGIVGESCSLASGPAGVPWIAFRDETQRSVRLAKKIGMQWHIETIAEDPADPSFGRDISLATVPDGRAAIAFTTSDGIRMARSENSDWFVHPIPIPGTMGIRNIDLAAHTDGSLAIAGAFVTQNALGEDRFSPAYLYWSVP